MSPPATNWLGARRISPAFLCRACGAAAQRLHSEDDAEPGPTWTSLHPGFAPVKRFPRLREIPRLGEQAGGHDLDSIRDLAAVALGRLPTEGERAAMAHAAY